MRRVLVTGSRKWVNRPAIWDVLKAELHQFGGLHVIQGGAAGATQRRRRQDRHFDRRKGLGVLMKADGKHPKELILAWMRGEIEHVVFFSFSRQAFVRYTDESRGANSPGGIVL